MLLVTACFVISSSSNLRQQRESPNTFLCPTIQNRCSFWHIALQIRVQLPAIFDVGVVAPKFLCEELMKLFQQLLVAPAALGLLASGANAAELNINGVSDYAASADQVTSVTQFSGVYPTDWAYQALSLIHI